MEILSGKSDGIENFWNLMGPFFASREMEKIQGVGMYDSPPTIWFLSLTDNGVVDAFCSAEILKSGKAILRYDYGNDNGLIKKRDIELKKIKSITVHERTILKKKEAEWVKMGFSPVQEKRKYLIMRNEIK